MNGDQNGLNIVKTNQSPTSEVVQKTNGIKGMYEIQYILTNVDGCANMFLFTIIE